MKFKNTCINEITLRIETVRSLHKISIAIIYFEELSYEYFYLVMFSITTCPFVRKCSQSGRI